MMMRYLAALFLGFTLFAFAAPANAASFDCGKARTKIEKMICADPQLSRLDESLAIAYRDALKLWNGRIADYVKMTQRVWVANRTLTPVGYGAADVTCEDNAERLTCLRTLYADRIALLTSPGFRLGGIYMRGKDMLRIKSLPTGLDASYALADPNAVQGFTDDATPVPVTSGQASVIFPLVGAGTEACRLDAEFTADAVIMTQHGPCSGNALGGRWLRAMDLDPNDESF